jgi:hypothetical protein
MKSEFKLITSDYDTILKNKIYNQMKFREERKENNTRFYYVRFMIYIHKIKP